MSEATPLVLIWEQSTRAITISYAPFCLKNFFVPRRVDLLRAWRINQAICRFL